MRRGAGGTTFAVHVPVLRALDGRGSVGVSNEGLHSMGAHPGKNRYRTRNTQPAPRSLFSQFFRVQNFRGWWENTESSWPDRLQCASTKPDLNFRRVRFQTPRVRRPGRPRCPGLFAAGRENERGRRCWGLRRSRGPSPPSKMNKPLIKPKPPTDNHVHLKELSFTPDSGIPNRTRSGRGIWVTASPISRTASGNSA